jgi:hypothetical protein
MAGAARQKRPVSVFIPLIVIGISLVFAISQIVTPAILEQHAAGKMPNPVAISTPSEQKPTPTAPVLTTSSSPYIALTAGCVECNREKPLTVVATLFADDQKTPAPVTVNLKIDSRFDLLSYSVSNGSCSVVSQTIDCSDIILDVNHPISFRATVHMNSAALPGTAIPATIMMTDTHGMSRSATYQIHAI